MGMCPFIKEECIMEKCELWETMETSYDCDCEEDEECDCENEEVKGKCSLGKTWRKV
jgi:hypothetical protein